MQNTDLLSSTKTTKQIGLYSDRVEKIFDRGEENFKKARRGSSRQTQPSSHGTTTPVNEKPIDERLDDALAVSVMDKNKRYIPRDRIPEILDPETVRTVLDKNEHTRGMQYDRHRLKLLAVLIGIEKLYDLPAYVEDKVTDECLPMRLELDSSQKIYCQKHKTYHEKLNTYRRSEDRSRFSRWSYSLTAPYISYNPERHYHYILDHGDVFPMYAGEKIQKKEITASGNATVASLTAEVNLDGGFSEVYRVKIEKSHHDFGELGIRNRDGYFALKKLNTSHEGEFNMELSSLLFSMDKASGKPASKHLVQLLATFEVSDPNSKAPTYYLLFDWAEGNLKDFWRENDNNRVGNKEHCKWMSEQFHEICLALQSVHGEREKTLNEFIKNNPDRQSSDVHGLYGRHGDIKPDNFLWFRPDPSSDLLALSDFGLGRLHTQVSRSNQNPKNIANTATYVAPEFDVTGGTISRASDIYSLGCVFLEHVTWYLRGLSCVIDEFPDARMDAEPYTGFKSDKFFMIKDNTAVLKPQVRDWIADLQKHEECNWYLRQLLDIIRDKMLEPDRTKRINIAGLVDEMEMLRKTCECDVSFYTETKLYPNLL